MSVKEEVLCALEENRGGLISGGALSERLGVSRTAVWKAIDALRESGMEIESVPGEGYRLRESDDSLTDSGIAVGLRTEALGRSLLVLDEVGSTNTLMKQEHVARAEGFTIVTARQTAGRGRLGRSFASPDGGLYMTVLLRPELPLARLNFLTIAAAVAVCRAVEDCCGFLPRIKWVNDVLQNGKKLCGILTEASIEGETGALDYVIVGIGVNLRFDPAAAPELAEIAGGLADFAPAPRRAALAAAILNRLEEQYVHLRTGETGPVIEAYRGLLCCVEREVTVLENGVGTPAYCTGVDDEGHLLVRMADGTERALHSGEISIRL